MRPHFLEVSKQYMLSKVICLALDALLSEYVEHVKIKWPNDIYVKDKKICGILIENAIMNSQISQTIIGVGLNINQENFLSDAPNPVSLKQLVGKYFDIQEVLIKLINHFEHFYQLLEAEMFDLIDKNFKEKLYRLEEYHEFRDKSHRYKGKITGVNEIGQLCIEEENGILHEYHFKEVGYI